MSGVTGNEFDWFTWLFVTFVISGWSNYFHFASTTLNWKPFHRQQLLIDYNLCLKKWASLKCGCANLELCCLNSELTFEDWLCNECASIGTCMGAFIEIEGGKCKHGCKNVNYDSDLWRAFTNTNHYGIISFQNKILNSTVQLLSFLLLLPFFGLIN